MLDKYDLTFSEYVKPGILEDVTTETSVSHCHDLPHRPLVKEDHATTKVRKAFFALPKYHKYKSLNDILDKESCSLPYLFGILRSHIGKKGLVRDIKKPFLQIGINESHQNYLRLVCRSSH